MLKSPIGKAVRVADDAGVETVLTLVFVAQFAVYAMPSHGAEALRAGLSLDDGAIVTGTVVQMPAKPNGARTPRATAGREAKGGVKSATTTVPKGARVRRPDPVDDELGTEEADQLRAAESSVRITIIGPDGEPRTKIVRLSGSRNGMTTPARRPHD
jgi:hypothetical protein